jgi:hypothetical protein
MACKLFTESKKEKRVNMIEIKTKNERRVLKLKKKHGR